MLFMLEILLFSLTHIFVHRYETIKFELDIWKNKQKILERQKESKGVCFSHGTLGQINTIMKKSLISITLDFSTAGDGQLQSLPKGLIMGCMVGIRLCPAQITGLIDFLY